MESSKPSAPLKNKINVILISAYITKATQSFYKMCPYQIRGRRPNGCFFWIAQDKNAAQKSCLIYHLVIKHVSL